MDGVLEKLIGEPMLDHPPVLHDNATLSEHLDHREVVGDDDRSNRELLE